MTDLKSQIESDPIPSIKSLKSRFEQFALDNASTSSRPTTISSAPVGLQSQNAGAPKPTLASRARTGPSPTPDEKRSQTVVPTGSVSGEVATSDVKLAALKRVPPPPPRQRIEKPSSSPLVSPLLRPATSLRVTNSSPECDQLVMRPDHKVLGTEESSDDGVLGGVNALRNRFSSATQVQPFRPSSPRPMSPRPPPRPPMTTSHSDSVTIEHAWPVIPPRHVKPEVLDPSPSVVNTTAKSLPSMIAMDASLRAGNVAAMRDRFVSKDVSNTSARDDNLSSHSEPNILVTSPSTLRVPHLPPRPLDSSLFARASSVELPSSSNSSLYSPFSDDESEISELSEVSLSPVVQLRNTSGSREYAGTNGILHERTYSGSSSESLSGLSPLSKPRPPPRPVSHAPPCPPRRPNGLSAPSEPQEASLTGSPTATPTPSVAPPLPARPLSAQTSALTSVENTPLVVERKLLGNARLPPPPTRMIAPGDKLPPVRRAHTLSSDEESGSEEDPRLRGADSLPDSSRSSRRPPSMPSPNFLEYKIQVPTHSGHVAVTGYGVVVASGHHIKFYDLSSDTGSSWALDTRDGMRGCIVSSLELRPTHSQEDKGNYLWVGTKEGHLLEVDLGMGVFTSSKMSIHASQVTCIFRRGSTMITIDDMGKVLVFDPHTNVNAGVGAGLEDDVNLVYTTPRVYRLGEKVEFVKLLGRFLWTAVRTDVNGVGTASQPIIRIYDIYAPGSVGRAVTPNHHAGAVTSGTVLPTQPDHIYLGHEGGFISVWSITTDDGIPACLEVVKVSASDVLCLEGVNDRLWAGGRKGTISVYDMSRKPWVVTNCWDAHDGLPVSRIFVDPYALVQREKLIVVSVGRDEHIRFWDGLLGADRVEQELLKREHAFSTFRDLKVLVVTWNVDAAKPESLVGDPENVWFLRDVLASVDSPDIISFGFQEVIDLESRKMAAKTVLLGGKKKGEEGKINEKVTSSYKRWHDRLIQAVKSAMPAESPYSVIHTESLVGLFTCIFVKNTVRASVKEAAIATIKRGMGGRYGNKGGIVARFVIDDSSLCFINCHLAAGQHHVRQRNTDVAAFVEEPNVFPAESVEEFGYVGGGDGSMVLDHEIVFLNGDMNYRIDQRREAVVAAIQANDLDALLTHDQLHKEMKHNRAFRLRPFREGPLTFAPTYKYDRHARVFDTSEKRRVPAWCDRVLWRSKVEERVALMAYRRWEVNVSDHRPVSAAFRVTVKKVAAEAREREKQVVEAWWNETEVALLARAKVFYASGAT